MKKEIILSRKLRIYPNERQSFYINELIDLRRKIWNECCGTFMKKKEDGSGYEFFYNLKDIKSIVKSSHSSVPDKILDKNEDVFGRLIRSTWMDYTSSWRKFFNRTQTRIPNFKSKKKSKQSVGICDMDTKMLGNRVIIPGYMKWYKRKFNEKCGLNPAYLHLSFTDKDILLFNKCRILRISFIKRNDKYYISISCKIKINPIRSINRSIGLDWGLKDFITSSRGLQYGNNTRNGHELLVHNIPQKFIRLENRIKTLNRVLSNKQGSRDGKKPSNNFQKVKTKLSQAYERQQNIKRDFVEKLTYCILKNFSIICIEDLDLEKIRKHKYYRHNMNRNTFYIFKIRLIEKSERFTAKVILANRYFPSSKTCCCCGHVKKKLSVSTRIYVCKHCGSEIPRDFNAAKNLEEYGESKVFA